MIWLFGKGGYTFDDITTVKPPLLTKVFILRFDTAQKFSE